MIASAYVCTVKLKSLSLHSGSNFVFCHLRENETDGIRLKYGIYDIFAILPFASMIQLILFLLEKSSIASECGEDDVTAQIIMFTSDLSRTQKNVKH